MHPLHPVSRVLSSRSMHSTLLCLSNQRYRVALFLFGMRRENKNMSVSQEAEFSDSKTTLKEKKRSNPLTGLVMQQHPSTRTNVPVWLSPSVACLYRAYSWSSSSFAGRTFSFFTCSAASRNSSCEGVIVIRWGTVEQVKMWCGCKWRLRGEVERSLYSPLSLALSVDDQMRYWMIVRETFIVDVLVPDVELEPVCDLSGCKRRAEMMTRKRRDDVSS